MCGIGSDWINSAVSESSHGDVLQRADEPGVRQALIIFAKNPALGRVKTRLAQTIGDAAAYEAYLQMLAHTRTVARQVDCDRWVYYSDFVDDKDAWSSPDFCKAVQVAGDLGHKMAEAFADLFRAGYERVLLVGTDILDLQPQHIHQAFRALEQHDFVLGPAVDGGYYLVGMRELQTSIFQNKTWSTPTVLSSTIEDIHQLNRTVQLVTELNDVDDEKDWQEALQRWQIRQRI